MSALFDTASEMYDDAASSAIASLADAEGADWCVQEIQELIDAAQGLNDPLSLDAWVASKVTPADAGCGGYIESE